MWFDNLKHLKFCQRWSIFVYRLSNLHPMKISMGGFENVAVQIKYWKDYVHSENYLIFTL